MRTSARAHYVGHNAVTRVPKHYVYLDTEAVQRKEGKRLVQSWRLGVAAHDRPTTHKDGWQARRWCCTTSTAELWRWITAQCRSRTRTVLVAHNLAYDMRISNAFLELPALGWSWKAGRVDDQQCWFIFHNGGRTLACVDSMSWVPVGLDRLGDAVGIPKLPLPGWDDSDAEWFMRCTRDVEILAEVWRRLMRWITDEDLGNWRLSGAGQSWAAFRHRFMSHRLFVHEDDDARAAERAAAHTGRCEAWKHGQLDGGPWTEWDYTTAYARIGAECNVPVKLCGEMRRPTLERIAALPDNRAALCEVEVTTDVPTLPTRSDTGICWPVGRFRTTVWDHELAVGRSSGARVDLVRAWVYGRVPALRDFCEWVLAGLDGSRGGIDPVVLYALKHWSRALIGRTAARWSSWETWGSSPVADVAISTLHDLTDDRPDQLMQLGHQLMRRVAARENPDAMVAIMSWVMAEGRVRLWKAIQAAGEETVAYMDTDSLIVSPEGDQRLQAAALPGFRVKSRWADLVVLGPRQIVPDGQLRAAGIPRTALPVGPDLWEATVWSGLRAGLARRAPNTVSLESRTFHVVGIDRRRNHLPCGATSPLSVSLSAVDRPLTA